MGFNVGTLLIGKHNNNYSYTSEHSLCVVLKKLSGDEVNVGIIAHAKHFSTIGSNYDVYSYRFSETTIEDYFQLYPNAQICSKEVLENFDEKYGTENVSLYEGLLKKKNHVDSVTGQWKEDMGEKYGEVHKEIMELLAKFDYTPTDKAVDKILGEWFKNKSELIQMFQRHPNYNGKYQIVFDYDYERTVDAELIAEFCNDMIGSPLILNNILVEYGSSPFSYNECRSYYVKYKELYEIFRNFSGIRTINGMSLEEIREAKDKWYKKYDEYESKSARCNGKRVTIESYKKVCAVRDCFSVFSSCYHTTLTDADAANINYYVPELKVKAGQKTSRAMNKLCKMFGLDKDPDYNKRFAAYSDGINPLKIKRHTILSIHPVDYLTMSFGNSWSSCHTIDRNNKRNSPKSYRGEYSSGTLSYLLDGTSMVMYTVNADYNGNEYELQDKINRNMFHYGNDKLIQGRVYPQDNDEEGGIYTTFREIAQKIISECMVDGINSWLVTKGTTECNYVTESYGTHYRDYLHYPNCNVSYYNKEKNPTKIYIGHKPICPSCGAVHSRESKIQCGYC